MDKKIVELAKLYVKSLPKKYRLKRAYLFGSHARGNASIHSDIDIALILDTRKNMFDATVDLMRLRRNIDLRIEPHPIKEKEFSEQNPLAAEILKYGIPLNLKGRNGNNRRGGKG